MKRRWILPVALALGVVIVLAVGLPWRGDKPPPAPDPSATSANPAATSLQWHVGVSQQYRVMSESSMRMQGATNSPSSIQVQLRGLLDTLTLKSDAGQALVGMRLSSPELKINGAIDAGTNHALAAPFRVRFAASGMPLAFEFPAEVSQQNRSILENLVRTFQVSLAPGDSWVTQETNGSGTYEAAYRRSGPNRFEKSKRRFTAAAAGMVNWSDVESTETFRLDATRDWIAAMDVAENMTSKDQGSPVMKVNNHATLALQEDARVALPAKLWEFTPAPAAVDDRARMQDKKLGMTPEQARREIRATIPQLDAATQGRLTLIHRLRDLLRVDASLPALILDALRTQELGDRTRADLYLALELAGTDSAQTALARVINDSSWSLKDGMRAIVAMSGIRQPSGETLSTLWGATRNYAGGERQRMASSAAFALGSIGGTLRKAEDPAYESLRADLLSNAQGARDTAARSDFITALGNTRDPTLAPDVSAFLYDPAPSVRRATALSLGTLGADPIAGELVTRFREDDNGYVRGAIAESLQSWTQPTESAMAMFRQAVRTEIDEGTRYNIAVLLSDNLGKFPANEPVLRDIMRSEPSKRIRQKVAEALAGNP